MISAIDTNILLDIFLPDPEFGEGSRQLIDAQGNKGRLIVSDVVYAELAGVFPSRHLLEETLATLHAEFDPCAAEAAHTAGMAWKHYRASGGTRQRVIADFLIGGHALTLADGLCTRDRGFYRKFFPALHLIEPD